MLSFEPEFFKLAGVVLQCLYKELHVPGDKVFYLLGYMDYSCEMAIILKENKIDNRNLVVR